jgi:hypothetical protein
MGMTPKAWATKAKIDSGIWTTYKLPCSKEVTRKIYEWDRFLQIAFLING